MDLTNSLNWLRGVTPWPVPAVAPWREAKFCVLDLETTGLQESDEVVSIGMVEIERACITSRRFYAVVSPRRSISAESARVHGLTGDEVVDAPPMSDVLPRVREFARGATLVAHAAWIERAFLNRALQPVGERIPERLVDTAALARYLHLAPTGNREPSLEGLSRQLGLPVHTPHHALGDAQTTAQLFLYLATKVESQLSSPVTTATLLDLSA